MFAFLSITFLTRAYAGQVFIENNTGYEVHFAFKYYDPEKSDWHIRGWFKVSVDKQLQVEINYSPDREFYWYARTYNRRLEWPGKDAHRQRVVLRHMNMRAGRVRNYNDSIIVDFATAESEVEGDIVIVIGGEKNKDIDK